MTYSQIAELSGRFAFGGILEQQARLEAEGIKVHDNRVDLTKYQFIIH